MNKNYLFFLIQKNIVRLEESSRNFTFLSSTFCDYQQILLKKYSTCILDFKKSKATVNK